MNVAAYLRKTLTGIPMSDQLEVLQRSAREREWNIVFHVQDPGLWKVRDIDQNDYFRRFIRKLVKESSIRIQGVMFWHAGHIAGSLPSFLRMAQGLDEIGMDWYVENPRLYSRDDPARLLMTLSSDLLGLHHEINGLNLRERSAAMRANGTHPGRQKIPPETEAEIRFLNAAGFSHREIAEQMQVSVSAVARVLRENPVTPTG